MKERGMANIRVELSSVIDQSVAITFYVGFPTGREIGFIDAEQPENAKARAAVDGCASEPHKPITLAGSIPPSISLTEERLRTLITESGTWSEFSTLSRR